MIQLPDGIDRLHLLYATVFLLWACVILGCATLLEPARAAPASVRRGTPMQWLGALLTAAFVPREGGDGEALHRWLLQAGYDAPNSVGSYFGIRLLFAILLPIALLLCLLPYVTLPPSTLLSMVASGAVVGFLAPVFIVRIRRASRQRRVREGMPDMLDLMLICSEAGLGLDTAILTVGEEIREAHPLLAEHLRQMSTELRAGLERRDAIRSFADRTGVEEAVSLANLLIQSDVLGTSMAQSLRAFSDDMRAHRMLKAEEQAHKISAKLTIVLVSLFLPAMFAAALLPAVYSAMKGLQDMGVRPW